MAGKNYAFRNGAHRTIEPTIVFTCRTISATEDLANLRYRRGTEIRAGEGISLAKDIPRSEVRRKMGCWQCLGRHARKIRKQGGGGAALGSCTATSKTNFRVTSTRDTAPAVTSMCPAQNGRVHALLIWLHEAQARVPGTEHRHRGAALAAYAGLQNCGAPHGFEHDR